jgi:hypothetical protein
MLKVPDALNLVMKFKEEESNHLYEITKEDIPVSSSFATRMHEFSIFNAHINAKAASIKPKRLFSFTCNNLKMF